MSECISIKIAVIFQFIIMFLTSLYNYKRFYNTFKMLKHALSQKRQK